MALFYAIQAANVLLISKLDQIYTIAWLFQNQRNPLWHYYYYIELQIGRLQVGILLLASSAVSECKYTSESKSRPVLKIGLARKRTCMPGTRSKFGIWDVYVLPLYS